MVWNIKKTYIPEEARTKTDKAGRNSSGNNASSQFSEFLRGEKNDGMEKVKGNDKKEFIDIFKSSAPLKEYISSKEDKKIVLKLNKK